MNQRIRELVLQANGSFGEGLEFAVVFGEQEDFEKFAELIVKECAQQAHDLADMLAMHRDKSGAEIAESVGNTIKEHFGVKE